MKTLFKPLSLIFTIGILTACSSSYSPYAYDDIYYKPSNDPVNKVRKDPREDFNKTDQIQYDGTYPNRYEENSTNDYPESIYDNRYSERERIDNNQSEQGQSNITINNNNNDNTEYYDEDYAETLNRINSPVRSINTYDPYTRDRIIYTQDPFFMSPTLFGGYTFWDPYPRTGLSIGYHTWSGWNIGFGIGYNYGYSPWRYRHPYYDPFFDPFWGYNPWSPWNQFGYGYGFGYGSYGLGYAHGYNHGFYNGYYGNGFVGGSNTSSESSSGVRRVSTPRGNSGSTTYREAGSTPTRGNRQNTNSPRVKDSDDKIGTRPSRTGSRDDNNDNTSPAARPKVQPNNYEPSNSRPSRSVTPEKYQIERSPADYSRPEPSREPANRPNERPSRNYSPSSTPNSSPSTRPNTPTTRPTPENKPSYSRPSYSRPTYNRPSRSNSYSRPSSRPQTQPQTRPQTQPQQSRPSYNRSSRPSYNNTPSYRPSGGGSRGGGSAPSRSTRPSRR